MCGAAFCAKLPENCAPASISVAPKPCKLLKMTAKLGKPLPQDQPPPMHLSGVVLDVVGTNRGNCGHSCKEHPDTCGMAVIVDDAVVRIQREQILMEDLTGKMKEEEMALTINWASDSIDRCCVGFLPKAYVPHANLWDGVLCQVVFIGLADDPSSVRKYHHYLGDS